MTWIKDHIDAGTYQVEGGRHDQNSQREGTRSYWSEPDGQIFFVDGRGYGIAKDLRTVCLGKEGEIWRYLNEGILPDTTPATVRQILRGIKEYRKELLNGANQPRTAGMERTKPLRTIGYRKKNFRRTPIRKRLSIHKAHR
jgi:hypothetical protein